VRVRECVVYLVGEGDLNSQGIRQGTVGPPVLFIGRCLNKDVGADSQVVPIVGSKVESFIGVGTLQVIVVVTRLAATP